MIDRLVLVGATGDLVRRHLLPGVARLAASGLLPERFGLTGVGRGSLSRDAFRDLVRASLAAAPDPAPPSVRAAIVTGSDYVRLRPRDHDGLAAVLSARPALVYLAVPPWAFQPAIEATVEAGIAPGSRIVVEKPFGTDGRSAAAINGALASGFEEQRIFRADHILHHPGVRAIVPFRFRDAPFEDAWTSEHIESVEITWHEARGIEGREDYFERTGALRDMIQSHLLELLSLILMARPELGIHGLRARRVAALRAIVTPTPHEVATRTARGRYVGPAGGAAGAGDPQRDQPAPDQVVETFASVELRSADPRWLGVPLILTTGKAIGSDRRSIDVRFRRDQTLPRGSGPGAGRTVRFVMPVGPILVDHGDGRGFQEHSTAPRSRTRTLPASARLILDALRGERDWFLGRDEPLEGWRIVEPVLDAWRTGAVPLLAYPPGGVEPVRSR